MSGSKSRSGVEFFPGQKEFAGGLFEPGGFFDNIRTGAPDVGFEAGAARGRQDLGRGFAQRGITGSGLETRALTDFETGVQQAREGQQFQRTVAGLQAPGGFSTGQSSIFTK